MNRLLAAAAGDGLRLSKDSAVKLLELETVVCRERSLEYVCLGQTLLSSVCSILNRAWRKLTDGSQNEAESRWTRAVFVAVSIHY